MARLAAASSGATDIWSAAGFVGCRMTVVHSKLRPLLPIDATGTPMINGQGKADLQLLQTMVEACPEQWQILGEFPRKA